MVTFSLLLHTESRHRESAEIKVVAHSARISPLITRCGLRAISTHLISSHNRQIGSDFKVLPYYGTEGAGMQNVISKKISELHIGPHRCVSWDISSHLLSVRRGSYKINDISDNNTNS